MKEYSMIVGLDLGDTYSRYCALDEDGELLSEGRVRTTEKGVRGHFEHIEPCVVAIETGTHTWWMAKLLAELGHEVVVANARKVRDLYIAALGIRCAICGKPLAWHRLTEPCI